MSRQEERENEMWAMLYVPPYLWNREIKDLSLGIYKAYPVKSQSPEDPLTLILTQRDGEDIIFGNVTAVFFDQRVPHKTSIIIACATGDGDTLFDRTPIAGVSITFKRSSSVKS